MTFNGAVAGGSMAAGMLGNSRCPYCRWIVATVNGRFVTHRISGKACPGSQQKVK